MKKLAAFVAAFAIVLGVGAVTATAAQADELGRVKANRIYHR